MEEKNVSKIIQSMHALVLFLSSYYQQHVSIGSSRLQASEISTSLERGVVVQVNTVYKLH